MGVSFETYLRRRGGVLMGRCHYVSKRRRHDIPIRRREDVPLRLLGNVPLRRRWVFYLRRTCDVTGTYKETSLRRRHDVLFPGRYIYILCNYTYTYIKKLCQQVFIYNEEALCTSLTFTKVAILLLQDLGTLCVTDINGLYFTCLFSIRNTINLSCHEHV